MHLIKKNKYKGSLILEMMIGLSISLLTMMLVTLVITQFEKQKKISTSVSEAISNNTLSVFPLHSYGKNAGFGFNSAQFLGCTVRAYNASTNTNFSYILRPIFIETNINDNPLKDKITITLGSSNNYYSSLKLTSPLANPGDPLPVNSRFGTRVGDALILAENGKDCTIMQVTGLPTEVGKNHLIQTDGTNYSDNGLNYTATFNKTNFFDITYGSSTLVGNFGRHGKKIEFSVDNQNQFIQNDTFLGTQNSSVLGEDIIAFKVLYGLDTNSDKNVDEWTSITPDNANLSQIIGFRYAVITRASTVANDFSGTCNSTQNSEFEWIGGTIDVSTSSDNWKCYRYRMLQGTVPLKNMLWLG
jgi:type IV pilus assembly protein PilW